MIILAPLLLGPGKRGPRFGEGLRTVVNAMLYVSHTGCQWRSLVAALHEQARRAEGREESKPSMVVIDTHLARGASNGGVTFHDGGGPYGRTKGGKRIVAVDVCGLPLAARVVPASTPEATTVELLLEDMAAAGQDERLELVLVDRGTSKRSAARLSARFGVDVRPVGWDTPQLDATGRRVFRPIRHAWRVEVAHGLLGRRRRLAKSFENTMASGTG